MASKSGSCKAILAVGPGSHFCKAAASASPISRSDSKSDKLGALEKGTSAPSYASTPNQVSASSQASTPTPVKPTLALKYSEVNLMRILKIFLGTKGQEPKAKVPRKQLLKAKVPDIYFGKSHIDCYHFCQQCKDYFETADTIRSNCTSFAALFFCGKINFQWYQYWKHLGEVSVPWEEFKAFLRKNLGDSRSFIDIIWNNIKRDFQYHLEEV